MGKIHIVQLVLGALAQSAMNFATANPQYAGYAQLVASVSVSVCMALGLVSGAATLTLPSTGGTTIVNPAPAPVASAPTPKA